MKKRMLYMNNSNSTGSFALVGWGLACCCAVMFNMGANCGAPPAAQAIPADQIVRVAFASQCAQNVVECTTSWPQAVFNIMSSGGQTVTLSGVRYIVQGTDGNGMELVQFQGSNSVLSVEFGASPTNAPELIAALRSNLPGIVLVPRSAFELVSVPYSELLDYRLVDIPFDQVSRIEISAGERLILERPPAGGWRFTEPAGVPADSGLVATLLEKLHDLRFLEVAKEVVTELDLPTYGLAPAGRSYTLHWRVGTNRVAGNSTSAWLRVDFGTNRADRLFARRSDEIPVYEVATQAVVALPSAPFQLRERRLCNFTTNQVVSFAVSRYGATRKGLRSPGGQWGPAPGSQWIVNTFALEEALYRLGTLQARYWVARGTNILDQYGIPQLAHRLVIEIQRDGRPEILTLDFGATSPSGGPFAAMELDGQPTIFEFPIEVFYPYEETVRSMKFPEPSGP